MPIELSEKKRVRAGYRAPTTGFLGQVDAATAALPPSITKITQLKPSLEDKLKYLNTLDDKILTLTPEHAIE